MSRRAKIWSYAAGSIVIILGVLGLISVHVLQSPWFADYVRDKIVSVTEESTGGKTELGNFTFDWRHLQATITDFTIHGTEPAGATPLVYAKRIVVRITLLASIKKSVDLSYLGIEGLKANVIVGPNGETNLPQPKVVKKPNKAALETVVDLAVGKLELTSGSVALSDRSLAFSANGDNVRVQLSYRAAPAGYTGKLNIGKMQYVPSEGAPLSASLDVPVEIGKDSIEVHDARFATPESQLTVTGSISHMSSPVMTAHAIGRVSLVEVRNVLPRTAGASMRPCANGAPCIATLDLNGRIDDQSIQISGANVAVGKSTLQASGSVKDLKGNDRLQFKGSVALQEMGRLFQVEGSPDGTVSVSGDAQFRNADDYILNGQVEVPQFAITEGSTRLHDIAFQSKVAANSHQIALTSMRLGAFGGDFDGNATLEDFAAFTLNGQLRTLGLRAIETAIAPRGGYDGVISGKIDASGNIKTPDAKGIRAQARLSIAPGIQGVPISGKIDAAYDGATGQVRLQSSSLMLPNSHIDVTGTIGSQMMVALTSSNANDFLPALAMAMKNPPAAMPVTLRGGRLTLQAAVNGPISEPQISGHLVAGPFAVEQRPFDQANVDFTASSEGAAIANGVITHQSLQAKVSGSIGLTQWNASEASPIRVALDFENGEVPDVLAFAGQSGIPATGRMNLSANITGTVGDPQGTARIAAANGAIYDQEYDRMEAQLALSDQLIRLVSLDAADKSALLQASGTYTHPADSLETGKIAVHVTSNNLPIERVQAIEKKHPGITGLVQLNGDVSGELSQVKGEPEFQLSAVSADLRAQDVRDPSHRYGNITVRAATSGSNIDFQANSDLVGSTIRVNGRTTLAKDYPTTADASIQNLSIGSVLELAGQNLPASGTLGFTGHVSGTWRDPMAEGQVTLQSAKVYDEPVDSLQAGIRYSGQLIEIPSLRMSTAAGNLALNATFSHPLNQFDTGRFQVHADAPNWNLAKLNLIQEQKPGLGGTLKLAADVDGDVKQGSILLSKVDGSATVQQIVFGGRGYGDVTLSSKTSGDSVSFNADSNFAKSEIHGSGGAKLSAAYPLTAMLTAGNIRLSNLREFIGMESIRPDVEAVVEAKATLSGSMTKPEALAGSLQISRLELTTSQRGSTDSTPALALSNNGPILASLNLSRMTIQSAKLSGHGTDVNVSGSAAFTGDNPMNFMVKATADLGLLQDIDKSIYSSGSVAVNAGVTGKYTNPSVNGTVQLKNASLELEGISNGISNANGTIALNGTGATVQNLTAQSGGGKIAFSGFAIRTGSGFRYSLRANAEHVRTRAQGITLVNSAVLNLDGITGNALLSGTVTVERVGINTESDIGASLRQASLPKGAASETSKTLDAIRLDVHVRTSPSVRFQTTLAKTLEGSADLNLLGTAANPGLVGRIEMTEGDLVFFGNEYTVDRGVISFYNPFAIEPRVDVSLETNVLNIQVTLTLTGPIDNLKLAYRSDPPLQFDEIVGLLATGKRPSSDPTIVAHQPAGAQQSVGQMGETALVSQAVAAPVSSRLQRVFGVSQLKIDPSFNSGSALPTAKISLQQQISNNITFTYTQDVTQSNSELIRVAWTFSPRFSAVATRDENGIFGVDFFYKRQFR